MLFDSYNECAREMLLKAQPLLQATDPYIDDEIGIVTNFIDSDQELRNRFAIWLDVYTEKYLEEKNRA